MRPGLLLGALLLTVGLAQAAPLSPDRVPEPLRAWIPWVLHGAEPELCTLAHGAAARRLCHWPTQLNLDLDAAGGRFDLRARVEAPGWLELPGDSSSWPQDVTVNDRAAPVLDRDAIPALWVGAGEHVVQGRFDWRALPESLRVPAGSGLLALRLGGREVAHPQRDTGNQLWLGRRAASAAEQAERLSLRVFRLIDDDIPALVTTQIQIEAGGEVREERIGPALLPGLVPLSLSGGLPARLDEDGYLRVQVRPGLWTLTLSARATAAPLMLPAPAASPDWAAQEIWSLRMRPELRVVEPTGLAPVDPRQTGVPAPWQALPAFLAEPGAQLSLAERQRGSRDLAPDDLRLQRQLWLDFDGGGYSVQDHLHGRLARTWRLDAQAPITLGRVQVDGQPQLITRHQDGVGVEVRHGVLNLSADSRIDDAGQRLPAGGWNTDLQGVDTTLHLPPAWRLIAAPGVDNVPDTWLARWTLLDLFLVLVAAIAALRLFGRGAALLTLLTLALTWHEPAAPRWAWLNLIAAIALLRALPASLDGGRLRKLLWGYQWIAAAILAFVALPFAVQQARLSLYPQLDPAGAWAHRAAPMAGSADIAYSEAAAPQEMDQARVMSKLEASADGVGQSSRQLLEPASAPQQNAVQTSIQALDPNVLTQTGPGLPAWHWRSAQLSWSGPVTADQAFRLWLIPPWLTRLLGWVSILLIAVLAVRWLAWPPGGPRLRLRPVDAATAATLTLTLALTAALLALPLPATALQAPQSDPPTPSQALLDELRERLIAPPDCVPHCAHWSRMAVAVDPTQTLLLRLSAQAQVDTALPLPVPPLASEQSRVWQPSQVRLDGEPATLLRDARGVLWLRVPAGRHEVDVSGDLEGFTQIQLPTAPPPKQVSIDAPGWNVSGVDAQGRAGSVIDLLREKPADAPAGDDGGALEPGGGQALPPLLRLTRNLQFGLVWNVESQLQREGNAQGALVASVPALTGEVVTGDAVRKLGKVIQASFSPGQRVVRWTSRLEVAPQLDLKADSSVNLFETWRFDISPLWHVDFDGLAPVANQEGDWRLVSFRPWPGETLVIQVARPQSVSGQVLTMDAAELDVQPGKRATDYRLDLTLRASQGGQHALPLPAHLSLQGLDIDGVPQPPRREEDGLILPLRPGTQQVAVRLRAEEGLGLVTRTPALSPGSSGVNARLRVHLPEDRWVLWVHGPTLGPAVLFWGVLAVLLAVAIALGRSGLTPLRGTQWALLMIGLSQLPVAGAAAVAGWLFALALRARIPQHWSARRFNAAQILLALWTLVALSILFGAVAQGLLGTPDMQIAGNDSTRYQLNWYQDRYADALPEAWVLSVSIWFYRGLMLLWALWLANSLLNWLRWGWAQYSHGGLWKKAPVIVREPGPQDGASS